MKIFIAGCARSGTTLTKRLMNDFADTLVHPPEAPIEQFDKLDQGASVQVVKRTWSCYRTLPDLPDDIRLLYCVRHPFDVLTSVHPETAAERRFHVSLERWMAEYEALRRLRARQPNRPIFFSRYEDLIANPDAVQQKISAFFGLTPARRFSENSIHSGSIEKWRAQPELRDYISSLPAEFLSSVRAFGDEFGYDGSPPRGTLRDDAMEWIDGHSLSKKSSCATTVPPSTLHFRYGFLAHHKDDRPEGDSLWRALDSSWRTLSFGSLLLRLHPESEIRVERLDDTTEVVVIGWAFSTRSAEIDVSALAANTPQALRNMSGRFAVIVSTRDGVSIFHDAFGARTIYYLKDNRRPVFASHAGLIGHAFGVPRSLEMDRLISTPEFAKRWVKYLPGDMTMFEGVFALVPNHSLNFPSMETYRYWPDRGVSPSTFDDFFQEIDALFMSTIDFLGDRYTPVFGITGGIDSRAVYSAWRKRGIAFRGFSWGRPRLKSAEIPIVNAIVSYLGVPHEMIDFSGKHDRAIAAIAGENIGEFRGSSPLAAEMYGFCARFPSAVFVRGHGGEIVRGFYNLESDPMENASPVEMARVYRAARPSEYASLSRAAFEDFHQRADYEGIDRYGFDINDIFYWEHRMGMWAGAMVNELDAAVLSFPGINSRAVYEAAFGLPREERLTKNLLRRVVQRYDPQLAEIAVDPR